MPAVTFVPGGHSATGTDFGAYRGKLGRRSSLLGAKMPEAKGLVDAAELALTDHEADRGEMRKP